MEERRKAILRDAVVVGGDGDMAAIHASLLVCMALLVPACATACAHDEPGNGYTLFVAVDDTKVSMVSGNLSVAVTKEWPRVVFWHTTDPFSPTFDIGFPRLHLFNDTDGDGRYCRSECVYTVHLDSKRTVWDMSPVTSDYSPELGEYAVFGMSATVDAYDPSLPSSPSVLGWARVTFWFSLSEKDSWVVNPVGEYLVSGKTEVSSGMTVQVLNRTGTHHMAVERTLQGGGSASLFKVMEDGPDGDRVAVLSARVDESLMGDAFARPINSTEAHSQQIDFAKEDGTVLAFHQWCSFAGESGGSDQCAARVNSSCYTTGTGMVLYSALPTPGCSTELSFGSSLGIVESGFVGRMRDWAVENAVALAVVGGAAAAVAVAVACAALRSRRRIKGDGEGPAPPSAKS